MFKFLGDAAFEVVAEDVAARYIGHSKNLQSASLYPISRPNLPIELDSICVKKQGSLQPTHPCRIANSRLQQSGAGGRTKTGSRKHVVHRGIEFLGGGQGD